MKKLFITTILLLSLLTTVFSQSKLVANTGDLEFDNFLKDLNVNAQTDIKLFNKNLSVKYNVPENKIESMIVKDKIAPADVFMILETAQTINKPADDVLQVYKKEKEKGWGHMAKIMGIKPGSREFHAMKGKAKTEKENAKGKGNSKSKMKTKPVKKTK
jgi:hypothetical protein